VTGTAPRKISRTFQSGPLKRAQKRHAQAVVVISALGALIVLALAVARHAPSRLDFALLTSFFVLTGLGITVGFHRHFTHCSFKAVAPVRIVLCVLGSMAMQGTLFFWVALHRRHHECSDGPGDPHSPYVREDGQPIEGWYRQFWHSYIGWTFDHQVPNSAFYARDLLRDRVIARVSSFYFVWIAIGLAVPLIIGGLCTRSIAGALSGLAWGGCIRIFCTHNLIWAITSLAHMIGRNEHVSGDKSMNSLVLALPTLGESWHNNHHAFPTAASLSFRWYQLDPSGLVVRGLELLGLAWDLGRPSARRRGAPEVKQLSKETE
jgi:stearoyl-CoA desaturase (delta-9 desaturase)